MAEGPSRIIPGSLAQEPQLTTNVMKSQLSRLYGQLYAFQVIIPSFCLRACQHLMDEDCVHTYLDHCFSCHQGKQNEALNAFAEDVYHCSLEFGAEDARSAVGYYNLGKVFANKGDEDKAAAVNDTVVKIWSAALCRVVLGIVVVRTLSRHGAGARDPEASTGFIKSNRKILESLSERVTEFLFPLSLPRPPHRALRV